jgi:hypothetical protein
MCVEEREPVLSNQTDVANLNKGKQHLILTVKLVAMAVLAAVLVLLSFELPRVKFILLILPPVYFLLVIIVFQIIELFLK